MSKLTLTTSHIGRCFRPGDKIIVYGGDGSTMYTIASVNGHTVTLNPNIWQRVWFWMRRQVERVEAWMWRWDERFEGRYEP